jgi:hypothetical protein
MRQNVRLHEKIFSLPGIRGGRLPRVAVAAFCPEAMRATACCARLLCLASAVGVRPPHHWSLLILPFTLLLAGVVLNFPAALRVHL